MVLMTTSSTITASSSRRVACVALPRVRSISTRWSGLRSHSLAGLVLSFVLLPFLFHAKAANYVAQFNLSIFRRGLRRLATSCSHCFRYRRRGERLRGLLYRRSCLGRSGAGVRSLDLTFLLVCLFLTIDISLVRTGDQSTLIPISHS